MAQQPPPHNATSMSSPYATQQPQPRPVFSPPGQQGPVSPGIQHYPVSEYQAGGQPPVKKQRLSPQPGEPPSSYTLPRPYPTMPDIRNVYSVNDTSRSPHFSNAQASPGPFNSSPSTPSGYSTPYTNGHPPLMNVPPANQYNTMPSSPHAFPGQPQVNHQQSTPNNYMMPPQGAGTMGPPPSKPAEKPKEDMVDPMDVLGGTGINLQEEEQYQFTRFNTSFNSQQSGSQSGSITSSHNFTQFPPAGESSFYGAGPANAAPEPTTATSQTEYQCKVAEEAWKAASQNLAISRQQELSNPFLEIGILHRKAVKIARENGVALRTDQQGTMGRMKLPEQFSSPSVNVNMQAGPDGIITATHGTFLPFDSLLVDQLALLSIATKQRLRVMIGDAHRLAKGRQLTSDGMVPQLWSDDAVPVMNGSAIVEGAVRSGWESAVSPLSNPLKRPSSTTNNAPTPGLQRASFKSETAAILRADAIRERDLEEERLKKRRAREAGEATPRQSSDVPGTPGSVAPDPIEKAPTKKEQRLKAAAKTSEAASHAAANVTTAQFLGGRGGIFGKNKKYSWMTGGGATGGSSGSSTPSRIRTQGLPGTPGALANAAPERLTADGARRMGTWRENSERGKGIQIRDWLTVLEQDGREAKALQKAYAWLDTPEPREPK